jgi:peptidoglycan/LPS O-acetylase OafA/YrhL
VTASTLSSSSGGGPVALPRQRTSPASGAGRRPDRGRDQYVDALRALALVRVVTYHAFGWIWLPVLFPSMAVMFALAGSLVAASLASRPGGHWRVLRKRVRRLLPPLWLYGAVLVVLMIRQGWTVTRSEGARLDWHAALAWLVPLEQPGGSAWGDGFVVPLWYIRTYLWLLLLSPALYWLFHRHPRVVLATPLALLTVLELRVVPVTGATGDTLAHLGMFGTCWLVGFAHHDGSLARLRRGRAVLLGLALMTLGLTWAFTHQLPGSRWDVDEIPIADALYGLGAVLVLLRLYPHRPVLAAVPWLAGPVAAMNARAMTIYLWGNAAIIAATPVIESNRWTRHLSAPTWQGRVAQYTVAWLILVAIVLVCGWVEDLAAGRAPRVNPWPRRRRSVPRPSTRGGSTAALAVLAAALTGALVVGVLGPAGRAGPPAVGDVDGPLPGTTVARVYPVHQQVAASVFRVGVLVPGQGDDGQSVRSGWDRNWAAHFGGCDGYGSVGAACRSDLAGRTPPDWFPLALVPQENPYYVGLPYNDLDDRGRRAAIPWARDPGYREHLRDGSFSLIKNRWVQVTGGTGSCYAQVEDTGPGPSDATYVLAGARPAHAPAINLSPALARCVGVTDAAPGARVDWAFVDRPPAGPWTAVPTGRQADQDGRRP